MTIPDRGSRSRVVESRHQYFSSLQAYTSRVHDEVLSTTSVAPSLVKLHQQLPLQPKTNSPANSQGQAASLPAKDKQQTSSFPTSPRRAPSLSTFVNLIQKMVVFLSNFKRFRDSRMVNEYINDNSPEIRRSLTKRACFERLKFSNQLCEDVDRVPG